MQFLVWPAALAYRTFSSIDILSGSYRRRTMEKTVLQTSSLWQNAVHPHRQPLFCSNRRDLVRLLWLNVSCPITATLEPVVRLIRISVTASGCSSYYSTLCMPVDSIQDTPIWLARTERTVETTSPLIGPWMGRKAAVYEATALIHARPWGEKREWTNTGRMGLVELLSVPDLSVCVLALKLYFPSQRGEHTKTTWQFSFFIFRLNSTPFSLAADYDVHSLLSALLWLASNQLPTLHCHSPEPLQRTSLLCPTSF